MGLSDYQGGSFVDLMTRGYGHTSRATDTQVGGSHYKDFAIQPIDFVIGNKLGFCEGNIIKYVCRHKKKGGLEDLLKARHYLDLLIEGEYPDG
jgi:hypothetical protein